MEYKGLTLDKFQEDAIKSIDANHSVVVSAPTGSGKTLIADYIINQDIKKGSKVIYTAPIKALSNQKYKEFSEDYGEKNVGLLTGDIVKNPGAPILIMTTEIYRNMAIANDPFLNDIRYVVFDEIHFINDIERGYIWEESIIFSKPNVRMLCLSATIPNADEFAEWIRSIKKHKVDVIKHDKRSVPLHRNFYDSELGITTLENIDDAQDIPKFARIRGRMRRQYVKAPSAVSLVKEITDKLPCFFFTFSRAKCEKLAVELMKKRLFDSNSEIVSFIRRKLADAAPEISQLKSMKTLRQTLPYGIAFHHAGLIPIMKELVEELFGMGLIKVLFTTETFAVGINMPAKTVCFESMRKFDGINFRLLNSKEYFQIAGRAGRRGIDKEGFVYAMIDRRDLDYKQLKKITTKDVDPIKSQFKLSVNTVLNLIDQHSNKEIDEILCKNFYTFQKYGKDYDKVKDTIYYTFNRIKKKLTKMGYVKDGQLTHKGEFSSKIYADEILTGEIFATDFYKQLNEFQILVLVACLAYEPREKTIFYHKFPSKFLSDVSRIVAKDDFLVKSKRFRHMKHISGLVDPVYHGKSIFDILENTSLLEGDLLRFFRQVNDRFRQIKTATHDERLKDMVTSCQNLINDSMKDIDII
ncbi:MAG: DEAD/DEAH box helicase [Nanoarchaeota archaeon]|nr:DEAD/DEAH box helicase [Nanoarchaeota archaeon]MCG2718878.1 DEAD/DEAH box helicase [Nanoarchaeota archaeon]